MLDRDTNVYRVDPMLGTYTESLGEDFDGDSLVVIANPGSAGMRGNANASRSMIVGRAQT